jgi:PAS domain S-box-containing protein
MPGRFISAKRYSVIYAVVTFFVLLLITQALVYERYTIILEKEHDELEHELEDTRSKFNVILNHNLSTANTVSMLYREDKSLTWFDSMAKELLQMNNAVDIVEFVNKDFIISHVYPLKGNEPVLGFSVLTEPNRRAEAQLALDSKRVKFAGPYDMLQGGGKAIAGRIPVFENGKFIGGAVVVTRLSTIRKRMPELENKGKAFSYQLSKVNAVTKKTEYFFDAYHPQKDWQVSSYMRRGNWTLHVAYVDGFISHTTVLLLSLFGILLSAAGAFFVYSKTHEALHLAQAVKIKTRDLDERVKELSAIFLTNEILKDERQSIEIAFSRVVNVIPRGLQYPAISAAAISVNGNMYTTDNYTETPYKMRAPVKFQDDQSGYVEVCYLGETPTEQEGAFLKEERNLLNALAETIEVYYNKKLHRDRVAKSEAGLRSMIEACPMGIMLCDKQFRVVVANTLMITTYSSLSGRSVNAGDNFIDVLLPDRRENVLSVFNHALDHLEPAEYDTSYMYRGATMYLTVSVVPVVNNGEPIGICMAVQDITTRKKIEMEHQRIINGLMQHITTLVEFARLLTGRVREPLSAILKGADGATEEKDENKRSAMLDDIRQSARRLDDMLSKLDDSLKLGEG